MNRKQRRTMGKTQPPSSPPADVARGRDPLELHSLGIEAFRAGQLETAAELIAQAIAANEGMADFHYNLAIVLKAQGKLPDAAASYERAILLKPDYADAHNNLGNVWKALGRSDKARDSFARALQARPGNADTHYNLGLLCSEAGESEQAARHFRHCLAHDPDDSRGIAILLAHLGVGEVPQRTSPAQLQKIYDVRARFWDQEGAYFGHALVAEALRDHAGRDGLDILDIGCGTGLVGAHVRPLANRLDGVDLAPAMLEKARDKGLYDRLDQAELLSFLSENAACYDAIVGAATLIHFADLGPVFQAAALSLRAGGLFVFTLFADETDQADFAVAASDRLAQSGCFRHRPAYVERLARQSGFSVRMLKKVLHEYDQDGNPVSGLVAVLQKA
jgi:predicted TPR repeat methyltransferase